MAEKIVKKRHRYTDEEKAAAQLTGKQEAFVEEYLANGRNGTKAAREAGYQGDDNAMAVQAHTNLRNPKIRSYIRERLKGVKANADEILYLLGDHLRADISIFEDCIRENGTLDLTKAREIGASHLVKKLKIRNFRTKAGDLVTTTEIELHDSQSAARTLAEIHGLKQQPRQNEDDAAKVSREIARLVSEGFEPEQAKQIVIEAEPKAARWLM